MGRWWSIAFVIIVLAPFFGIETLSITEVLRSGSDSYYIFWSLRVPRVLTAFLAGGLLSVSGLLSQSLLRNPLATPYSLGISSGASLGAVCVFLFVTQSSFPFISIGASWMGALIVVALLLGFIGLRSSFSSTDLLLFGLVMTVLSGSFSMLLQYLLDFTQVFRLSRWLMGTVSLVEAKLLLFLAGGGALGIGLSLLVHQELDLLSVGFEFALSRGVRVKYVIGLVLVSLTLLVGTVVALCGPLSFVGLLEPLAARTLIEGGHKRLVAASFLLGGSALVVCDLLARVLISPAEIPVGLITGCVGGSLFCALLIYQRRRGGHAYEG